MNRPINTTDLSHCQLGWAVANLLRAHDQSSLDEAKTALALVHATEVSGSVFNTLQMESVERFPKHSNPKPPEGEIAKAPWIPANGPVEIAGLSETKLLNNDSHTGPTHMVEHTAISDASTPENRVCAQHEKDCAAAAGNNANEITALLASVLDGEPERIPVQSTEETESISDNGGLGRDSGVSENLEVNCRRFVIWKGASLDECSLEDREWLAELLRSLDVESLQDLNGISPSEVVDHADRFNQVLSSSGLGRLVRVFLPGNVSLKSSNFSAPLLSQSVDILELSVRSAHCLEIAGVTTIGELTQWSTEKLLTLKNMGRKSAMEIKAKLDELLLSNADESKAQIPVSSQSVFLPGTVSVRPSNFSASLLSQSVNILDLSVRSTHCLEIAGVTTIGDLTQRSTEELLTVRGMGRKSAMEIKAKLEALLLCNADESEPQLPVMTQSFCLSVLLSLEQCGIDEDILESLNEAGISSVDDLITRSKESIRYGVGLTDAEVCALDRQLGHLDLHLESSLPEWMRTQYLELKEAFKEDLEQLLLRDTVIYSAVPMRPTAAWLEEELDSFFNANVNNRKKQIIRRLMGWDGGPGTTLDQAGQEFDLTRERIRQILAKSLRALTVIRPTFLRLAIECVERCVPASAESAELALIEAEIARSSFRLEGVATTAKHLGLPIFWSIEEWNARRFVVNSEAMSQIRDFLTVARKRVSRYGITRVDYVRAELSKEVKDETIDLYCSVLEGIVWLDDLHDWFWFPTARNSVLNRLAKILRVAPRLALSEARGGVLRDRRMEDVELPPDVFRKLCAALPWCHTEGDELVAACDIPVEEQDSDETLLVDILRRNGPVMRRRDLWRIARESGIEIGHFGRLLSDSNVIVNYAHEFYGIIGSTFIMTPDQVIEPPQEDVSELSGQPEIRLPTDGQLRLGVFDRCDPESADFHEQALSSIVTLSSRLRASGTWSLMELGMTSADFDKLRRWGKTSVFDIRDITNRRLRCGDLSMTGIEAIALTFLACCCEIGRNAGTEGELWPVVAQEIGHSLHKQIFASYAYPKPRVRDATESICSKLNIRHVFGREGEQSWLRSVFLQFGITRNGWKRLPWWLAGGVTPPPVVMEVLLQPGSGLHARSFSEFWQTLQKFRWQQLSPEQARKALARSPWVIPSEIEDLLNAAKSRPEVIRSEHDPDSDLIQARDRLIESPLLTWRDEPRFELPINTRCQWLAESRYVLVLDSVRRIPLTRNREEYTLDLPGGKLEVDLREAIVTVDLQRCQASCLSEPLAIRLAPEEYDFAFYGPNGGMLRYREERFDSNRGYLLLSRRECTVTVEPDESHVRRVFQGEWIIRAYLHGLPDGLEIQKEGHVIWAVPQQSPRTAIALEKPKVVCVGGRWGEFADFILHSFDEGDPTHLLVNGSRVPFERTSLGKARAALVLSPNVDYNRAPVSIECESNGRLRRTAARLQIGPITGIAVETEEGWKVFKERVDMDVEYLRTHRILTHVPSHYDGDRLEVGDWAWMEGDHFCGRPRNTASTIGGALHALGESLRLAAGPYNRPFGGHRLARGVIHSGVLQSVEQDGEEYQIQLRSALELGPDHAIWVWRENQPVPEFVAASDWIQEDDTCLVHSGGRPVAFAISFQGAWLGARTSQMGWKGFADVISSSPDWRTTAQWLRWWRVPLLHENLKAAVGARIVEFRIETLCSWTSTENVQGNATYSEEHEDAWRSVTRRFLWDWKPDATESASILKRLGLLTGDPDQDSGQAWDGCEELLTIHPLLLAMAARRGLAELYPGHAFEDLLYLLEKLRNRILDLDLYANGSQTDRALLESRIRAAEAMAVDEAFVTRRLLPDAIAFVSGALARDHNLRVAIANSQAVRKYLAAAVIEKMIHGEIE